ncbi:protein kinase domain-containing protein [Histoplasma ohiense]|nr:protein kinase domain-containing protein [Histoplasma ohiense (nom. inval.)]
MNVVNHNNNYYYQMVVSDNHSILTCPGQLQPLPEPCAISVVTALLLGNDPAASYTNPPTARIVTEYVGSRQSRTTRNTGGGNEPKTAKRGEPALRSSRAGTTAGTGAHVHQEMRRSSRLIEAASQLYSKHDVKQFTPQRTLTDIANSSPLVRFTVVSEFRTARSSIVSKEDFCPESMGCSSGRQLLRSSRNDP